MWRLVTVLCLLLVAIAAGDGRTRGTAFAQSGGAAPVASTAAELTDAFDRLQRAGSEPTADLIIGEIWDLWRGAAPAHVRGLSEQAGREMNRGDLQAAAAILDEVVRQAPAWPEGWNQRATVLYLLGDHDRSLADCDRVLTLEPRHFGALAGMGLIHMAAGHAAKALAAFKRALQVNPFLKERHELIPALEKQVQGKPL